MNKSRWLRNAEIDRAFELGEDFDILEGNLKNANKSLQAALKELDHQLQESTATLYGHKRGPNHKERCAATGIALDKAHDEIAKANKDLFQFKLRYNENEYL